ncbi:MAG TPA: hypothetical protein VE781_12645 [Kineosporiaceae bacterium]|jgi:hypothetical protein|nr:hypothetical protein [Kineosporiaceae bacterium]
MADSTTEEILRRVAAGELTPEEALPLLDAVRPAGSTPAAEPTTTAPGGEPPVWGTPPGPTAAPASGGEEGAPRRVRIAVSYRSLRVLADSGVDGAFVTGEHTVRREGDALVVEASGLPAGGDDEAPGKFSFSNLPRTLSRAREIQNQELTVRFNPQLPLEVDVAGASVRISGGEAGARIRLLASALKVDVLRGPVDLDAVTSSVKGTLGPTGSSRISAESSSVKVGLVAGTGLRISARNRMGKVVLPTGVTKGDMVDPGLRESTVGDGRGELVVESVMSSVVIGADVVGAGAA